MQYKTFRATAYREKAGWELLRTSRKIEVEKSLGIKSKDDIESLA